jgi:hypothetical protein
MILFTEHVFHVKLEYMGTLFLSYTHLDLLLSFC